MSGDPSQKKPYRLPLHLTIESEPLDEPEKQNGMESEKYEDFDDGDPIIEDPVEEWEEWDGQWE